MAQTFPGFNSVYRGTVEWRLEKSADGKSKPFATILRWNIITPSQYEWERRGLDFIRTGLPDHDPYRAWANFEFQTEDGAIYEIDLLVLTKQGFWLLEAYRILDPGGEPFTRRRFHLQYVRDRIRDVHAYPHVAEMLAAARAAAVSRDSAWTGLPMRT